MAFAKLTSPRSLVLGILALGLLSLFSLGQIVSTTSSQLYVGPSSLSFGNANVGSSVTLAARLRANGATVTVNSATLSNPAFVLSGVTLPFTVTPGHAKTVNITFTPSAGGTASGTVTFVSTAKNSPTVLSLSGTGVTSSHSVTLSWNASASQVVGYNVYRGATQGGPYDQVNTSLDSATTYTDSGVVAGQTYYYVATSVDSSGDESTYSNEVKAVVPSPK